MACKLVAIYQKSFQENTVAELSPQKIDDAITTANKYYAVFDLEKFQHVEQSEVLEPTGARSMVQP